MAVVLISGSRGLIGRGLVPYLQSQGHHVVPLVRVADTPLQQPNLRCWNPATGHLPAEALEGIDAVVHLAGPSINARWSDNFKLFQIQQRVGAVHALVKAYQISSNPPKTTLLIGGIGAYGCTVQPAEETAGYGLAAKNQQEVLNAKGLQFLSGLSHLQDQTAAPLASQTRLVLPRLGLVLHPEGGALQNLMVPYRMGLGGPIGDGLQLLSWIGRYDCLRAITMCLDNPNLQGPVNVVTPKPLSQAEFAEQLACVWGRSAKVPLPGWAIRILLGEMAELLLSSSCAIPSKLQKAGFIWQHLNLTDAVRHELGKSAI